MNGLTLRIVRGGAKKSKNLIGYPPVSIDKSRFNILDQNQDVDNFTNASTTDEQMSIIKKLLQENVDKVSEELFTFLVVVFLLSDAKHPVKCFITRHITKTERFQLPFSTALADQLLSVTSRQPSSYVEYMAVVSKVATCIENFPTGAAAVKKVDVQLAGYLTRCLECCIRTLKEEGTLSPTEKNELFSLAHLALRLLLHIVQKSGDNSCKLSSMYTDIRLYIVELVSHEDVPMDTKSVSGILFLTMHIAENGSDSWIDIVQHKSESAVPLQRLPAGRLSLLSAAVTVLSADQLTGTTLDGRPTALVLAERLIEVGESNSSESPFTLGVSRSLLQLSKLLPAAGRALVGLLLPVVWTLAEHHLDSVRHLASQMLGYIVKFCAREKEQGDEGPINNLFSSLSSLDRHRKSYLVSVSLLSSALGAAELAARRPGLVAELMAALGEQAVQASATIALETLMQQHIKESDPGTIHAQWVTPVLAHVSGNDVDSTVLSLLESLLAKAVAKEERLLDYILPYIRGCDATTASPSDLKCVLMLASAVRRSRVDVTRVEGASEDNLWRGLLSYDVLRRAAVDPVDETRIVSLSLLAASCRSTAALQPGELQLLLLHVTHVAHATPSYRQLLQAPLTKFMKRLEDSYKVLLREKPEPPLVQQYREFVEQLRRRSYAQLPRGANYSRRRLALQLLRAAELLQLPGLRRSWCWQYVERLLLHLEDSYENNKLLALEILETCPKEMLQNRKYSVSLDLEDILKEASSLKPTDCVSAAYKLELLRRRLPESILKGDTCTASEPASYSLAVTLLTRLQSQLSAAQQSIVRAARDGAMYGLLHCLGHLFKNVDAEAISACPLWRRLSQALIATCLSVCAAAACVVNNSSPEGHLPMDAGRIGVGDHGNSGGIVLDDGRPVTAQMVLLCAWRSVKEVSLLLGTLSSRLSISSGDAPGTLSCSQLRDMGEHFTALLAETKHRGAFEQAYVGFTELLARLWSSRIPELHSLPRSWLSSLIHSIAAGDARDATRRSAGLPFMIQALVTTEVQIQGNPKCFHHCMTTLLRLARPSPESGAETRIHCLNILRALFRNSALDESVAGYVGEGFVVALSGFEGDTWAERNASTLAFSALMSRVFGAPRARGDPRARSRMTGRVFFLRYPRLYDFMVEKLQAPSNTTALRPVVFPVLVLLSRLYPSSLEGTESALRLAALLPKAAAIAHSPVYQARVLAAKAVVPLVSPLVFYSHIEGLLKEIQAPSTHNYTHGVLLQLSTLLGAKPEAVAVVNAQALSASLRGATWVLRHSGSPDYLLLDELVKVLNMVVWRLPSLMTPDLITFASKALESLLFTEKAPLVTFGREVCLTNAMYLLLILYTKYNKEGIPTLICNDLVHRHYDVTLAILNYVLILHEKLKCECKFQEHLHLLRDETILTKLRESPNYIPTLCRIFENSKYLECVQKSLKILTLEKHTQKRIVQIKTGLKELSDEMVVRKLFELIYNEHENLTHVYLESLSTFVNEKLKGNAISIELLLDVVRVIFACSTPDNNEDVREVVVNFLEKNFRQLIEMGDGLSEENKFEYTATLWCAIATLLEDDEPTIRQLAAGVVCAHFQLPPTLASRAAALLRARLGELGHCAPLYVVLALLDFKAEVCLTDDISDECRVFDQNERHNVILEETVWTDDCADKLRTKIPEENKINYVYGLCDHPTYKATIDKLCNHNVVMFKRIAKGEKVPKTAALNPKIQMFADRLTSAEGLTIPDYII